MIDNPHVRRPITYAEAFDALSALDERQLRELVFEMAACIPTDDTSPHSTRRADCDAVRSSQK
jgi:hypothetical protein